ncbi:hypothetical protein TNCV_4823261 [Trichonephila clavipes]|nr:hypothetical protein TNCV_4823261 [Trichonephila clavipes]
MAFGCAIQSYPIHVVIPPGPGLVGMKCHSGPKDSPRGFSERRDKAPSQSSKAERSNDYAGQGNMLTNVDDMIAWD